MLFHAPKMKEFKKNTFLLILSSNLHTFPLVRTNDMLIFLAVNEHTFAVAFFCQSEKG